MAIDQVVQGREVEGHLPDRVVLEEIRLHAAGQASPQRVVDRLPLAFWKCRVSAVPVQFGDHRGMNVLGDHDVVAQVERRRVDSSGQELGGFVEVGTVMRNGPAVGDVHGHPVAASGPPGTLPVVRRQRGHVAHQHRVELADVDAQLQCRCANQQFTASDDPLNRFSSRSRSSFGTIAVCSSGRSME